MSKKLTTTKSRVPGSQGQVILGPARFTVITPHLVRMEYAARYGFVDVPTLFARCRETRDGQAKIQKTARGVVITTSVFRLEYQDDGKPFHAGNLRVVFAKRQWQQ